MDQSQIYSLAKSAGLPDDKAKIAAAIAMAESGGNPNSHNSTPPDDSYGLWQINMLGSLGPSRRALYGLKANTDLFDPATNARVMSAISAQGKNFSAWSTYNDEKYKQFLGNSVSNGLVGGLLGVGGSAAVGAGGQALSDAASVIDIASRASTALTKTAAWVSNPANWVRVAYVIVGGTAILLGITSIARQTSAGQAVTKAGKKVVKTAAKVAV